MITRLRRKFLYSRTNRRLIGWAQRIVPPGFEGFSMYAISRFFARALNEGQLVTRASAISFKLFLAFFPAVIVLLTFIPFIPIADFQSKLMLQFHELMPAEVYAFVESTLHDLVVKKHSTLLSVSFLIGLYVASNSVNAILLGFSESKNLSQWHSPLKQRLLSLGLLFSLTVMVVVAILLLTFTNAAIGHLDKLGVVLGVVERFGIFAAKWVVSFLLLLASISLLYNAGDPHARRFKLITPGAILALVLVLLVSQALAFVFGHITNYNALYGSIGAIIAVQLWIYFNMIVILVGFELNTSIARAKRDHSEQLRLKAPAAA